MASRFDEALASPVQFFAQQKFNYCGPACSQMFLSHFSINIIQSVAFETIRGLNTESDAFYSDPDGISRYLSDTLPDDVFDGIVDDFSSDTAEEALNKIYYTIHFLGIPCIALVLQGAHWILIDGVRYTLDTEDKKEITAIRYKDPYENSPNEGYKFIGEFRKRYLTPNTKFGDKWKDKFVVLSKPTSANLLSIKNTTPPVLGGGADPVLAILDSQGFTGARNIIGGGFVATEPINVTDLEGISDFTIVPVDATSTQEFKDLIYVAIEQGTDELLEIATLSNALQLYNDREMKERLQTIFLGATVQIEPGYFWKFCFELRSRLSVVRRFSIDGKEMFLLPNGNVTERLTDFIKAGG